MNIKEYKDVPVGYRNKDYLGSNIFTLIKRDDHTIYIYKNNDVMPMGRVHWGSNWSGMLSLMHKVVAEFYVENHTYIRTITDGYYDSTGCLFQDPIQWLIRNYLVKHQICIKCNKQLLDADFYVCYSCEIQAEVA